MKRLVCMAIAMVVIPIPMASSQSENEAENRAERQTSTPFIRPSFTAGIDFSRGDFGADSTTETLSTPFSARADVGDFRFSVGASWLQITGPGGVVGDGIIVDGAAAGDVETNSGFGDLTLGVNYNVPAELTGDLLVQLQGRLKVPTADEDQGLGTGELDGGVAVDLAYSLGNFTPFTTVGFRWRGDPEGADLNNTFNVSVGGSYNLGRGYAVLASYDFREETVDTAEESQEVFGAITGPINDQLRWTFYGSVGFTEGAPDGGVGFQLIWRPGN
ncbi:MAG: transporter [Pseudomonadota bacterium]